MREYLDGYVMMMYAVISSLFNISNRILVILSFVVCFSTIFSGQLNFRGGGEHTVRSQINVENIALHYTWHI